MQKANIELRMMCKQKKVPLWLLADRLGISDQTLYRKLRYPLSESDYQRAVHVIDELSNEIFESQLG